MIIIETVVTSFADQLKTLGEFGKYQEAEKKKKAQIALER